MATYRVYYKGYMDVIADSNDEAQEKYFDGDCIQSEAEIESIEKIDDEEVFVWNLDEDINTEYKE